MLKKKEDSSSMSPDEIKSFVDQELEEITASRKGQRSETRTIAKQVEFGAFFAAGDCCTDDGNT